MKLKHNFIHFSGATSIDAEPDPRNPGQAAGHAAYDAEPAARSHTGGSICRGEIAPSRHEKLHTHTKGIHGRAQISYSGAEGRQSQVNGLEKFLYLETCPKIFF